MLKIPTTPKEIELAMKQDREALKKLCEAGKGGLDPAYPVEAVYLAGAITLYCMIDLFYASLKQELSLGSVLAIVVGMYFFTDVISALLHVVLDNPYYLDPNNFFGLIEKAAKGFQEHHLDTTLICRMSVFDHLAPMGISCVASFVIGYLVHNSKYLSTFQLSLTFWLCLMQMAHRWSHMTKEQRGPLVDKLQKLGVILTPAEHLKHHRNPYDCQFAIMSGLFNPIFNRIVAVFPPTRPEWIWAFVSACFVPHILIKALL
jgi:hypothetical protein